MAAVTNSNLEEAANVAAECVSSLDNLPNEVQHILGEIRHLEKRCHALNADIVKDQNRYIKHSLRQSNQGGFNATSSQASSGNDGQGNSGNSKAHLPERIAAAYALVEVLNNEKIELAKRLIALLSRAQARLDADVVRVRTLQGEHPEDIQPSLSGGPNPAAQISESLRSALSGTFASADSVSAIRAGTPPATSVPSLHGNKKRRLNGTPSIKLPAPSPVATSARAHSSRHHTKAQVQPEPEVEDVPAEEEYDEGEEEEDLTLYCFCQKQSYGDMIGCDNADCPYQWFHISCVGVKTPLPDKWYCPECQKQRSERRKNRRK
ncbi:hypothetical protein CC2G_010126 [Coprinopsis cinerea AmutBmut pab1-1]|nr:hypothetical protein CC2G_010126 [Coprinopsis cinerea AmutBmut pab1-1]